MFDRIILSPEPEMHCVMSDRNLWSGAPPLRTVVVPYGHLSPEQTPGEKIGPDGPYLLDGLAVPRLATVVFGAFDALIPPFYVTVFHTD